jgi:GTP-binding protein LepA
LNTGKEYNADEIGVLRLKQEPRNSVKTGDVGYIISGIKEAKEVKVGDTITNVMNPCEAAIQGFEDVKPMVLQVFTRLIPKITKSCATAWKSYN